MKIKKFESLEWAYNITNLLEINNKASRAKTEKIGENKVCFEI